MAKKKEEKINPFLLALAIIIMVVCLVILCGPVILLITSLVLFLKWKFSDKPMYDDRFFWLTKAQQKEFFEAYTGLHKNIELRNDANRCVDREGISRKADGSISTRSNRGKILRQQYNDAQYWVLEYQPIVNTLKSLPYECYEKARKHYVNSIACLGGVVGYAIVLLKDHILYGDFLVTFKFFWNHFASFFGYSYNSTETSIWWSIGIILISYAVSWIIAGAKFSSSYIEPPVVDIDNYNKYIPYAKARCAYNTAAAETPTTTYNVKTAPKFIEKSATAPIQSTRFTTLEKLSILDQAIGNKSYDRHGIWEDSVLFYELNADKDGEGNICQGNKNKSIAVDIVITEKDEVQVAVFTRENNLNKNKEMAMHIFGKFMGCPNNPERHCAFCKSVDFNNKKTLYDSIISPISDILDCVYKYREAIVK